MEYRAVGNRCAFDLDALALPATHAEVRVLLRALGMEVVVVDIIALARACVGTSVYRRGAHPRDAPQTVDCSSLMKWLYGERGVWLPRRAIQQRAMGEVVAYADIGAGDLVFTSGRIDRYDVDPADGVGHVGIATGDGTVVHAASTRTGIIETSLPTFAPPERFRGARRHIPHDHEVVTVAFPASRCVEIADDILWLLRGALTHSRA